MHGLRPPSPALPPRPARRGLTPGALICLLIVTALAVITLARHAPQAPSVPQAMPAPEAGIAQTRTLRFADEADGSVAAIDADSGELVRRFEGEQGFLRGTLRALLRERRMRGIDAAPPFQLILHRDGRLTLHDPSTGTRIALESFGETNTRVFARLLR